MLGRVEGIFPLHDKVYLESGANIFRRDALDRSTQTLYGGFVALMLAVPGVFGMIQQQDSTPKQQGATSKQVSFKDDVAPVIKRYCLPCHDDESNNPSELSLDTYELLMKGGKHGVPVVAGRSAESIQVQKLSSTPPFGDSMPLTRRKKSPAPPKTLTEDELRLVEDWINQGAKND